MGGCVLLRLVRMAVVVAPVLTLSATKNAPETPDPFKGCRRIDREVGVGNVSTVERFSILKGNGAYFYLYFRPEEGFQGFRVEGVGTTGTTSVWFPSNTGTECFRRADFDWWRVDVTCTYNRETQYIWFYMLIGICRWSCAKRHVSDDLRSINLVAYGPSKWRQEFPADPCVTEWLYPANHQDKCWDPPPHLFTNEANATDTALTASRPLTSINLTLVVSASVVAVVVILVVVVVVVVVKVRARRQERSAASAGRGTHSGQGDTVYYDVMDTRRNTENIYEDIDGTSTRHSYITPLPPTSGGLKRVWMSRDGPPLPCPPYR